MSLFIEAYGAIVLTEGNDLLVTLALQVRLTVEGQLYLLLENVVRLGKHNWVRDILQAAHLRLLVDALMLAVILVCNIVILIGLILHDC